MSKEPRDQGEHYLYPIRAKNKIETKRLNLSPVQKDKPNARVGLVGLCSYWLDWAPQKLWVYP